MCKKQTSVSHSSTEAEIISLDAGLRMDGIPALSLGFGGWSISFRTEQNWWIEERATVKPVGNCQAKHAQPHPNQEHKRHSNKHWSHPRNTTHSDTSAMLYVFDNESVIKMITKSRSPTMWHVSRTHRAALDWLFDKIHLDPKIQICFDTKHQLADMLTKGNFKRDEWNNLIHVFNISHFSSTCCTKNFSLISCSTMAKRIQDQKE